ncbi:hypothetical protein ACWGIU_00690 [Streptomyces sp. NPDC054840]
MSQRLPLVLGRTLDQGLGDEPVGDVRQEQCVPLLALPVPRQQQRQVAQSRPLPVRGEGADESDGLHAPAPGVQQPSGLGGRRPPVPT